MDRVHVCVVRFRASGSALSPADGLCAPLRILPDDPRVCASGLSRPRAGQPVEELNLLKRPAAVIKGHSAAARVSRTRHLHDQLRN